MNNAAVMKYTIINSGIDSSQTRCGKKQSVEEYIPCNYVLGKFKNHKNNILY
jgi:hypothetical protein